MIEGCFLDYVIPIAGVAAAAWLVFKSRQGPKRKQSDGSVYVDLDELLKRSSINKTWKSSTIPRTTASERVENATITVNQWLTAGYPMGVALAALVNADYESRTSNKATGDSGNSFGLYQLHVRGAGKGMTEAQMRDPVQNTLAIMRDYASGNGDPVDSAMRSGATLAQMAGLFGKYVERPANKDVVELRTAYARKLFPEIADVPGKELV